MRICIFLKYSYMQCKNVFEGFKVNEKCPEGPVLLIDDLIDSRWIMAVCGALLRKSGVAEVYPFALASTATWEGG